MLEAFFLGTFVLPLRAERASRGLKFGERSEQCRASFPCGCGCCCSCFFVVVVVVVLLRCLV